MKNLQQFSQPNFMFIKTKWVFAIVLSITTLMSGCKKDFLPPGNAESLNPETRTASSKSKAPDIIVHAGGSIQGAVDAANAGDIIQIEAATYREAIVVNKPGIQLIGRTGAGNERVIIENPGDEDNGITVRSNGDGFVLKNVIIQNFEENGVFMIRADNFLLSHVDTKNNGEYGLFPCFAMVV